MTKSLPPKLPTMPTSAEGRKPQGPVETRTSKLAVASLVLGILSCPLSFFAALPGAICGILGLTRISKSATEGHVPRLSGRGLAIAGIILSCMGFFASLTLVGLLLPAIQSAREAARRSACSNNGKQLALGMLNLESASRVIPAAIVDEDGTPLLSWRVAILPFLEETELFEQFHLDEPWDSEHNIALIEKMPPVYACPSTPLDQGRTTYLALTGDGSALGGPYKMVKSGRMIVAGVPFQSMTDGSSKTLVLVEVAPQDAVPWTKPEEVAIAAEEIDTLLERPTGHTAGLRLTVFGDGHTGFAPQDIDAAMLKACCTRRGGESIVPDF
jgi:hypothetical protein